MKRGHYYQPYRNKNNYKELLRIVICQKLDNLEEMDKFPGSIVTYSRNIKSEQTYKK